MGYNRIALELMESHGIPVNDLHSVVMENVDINLSDDQLHLSEVGKKKCADAVVSAIKVYL